METQVRTPQSVFMHPQRFVVPLFQRPYVWNQENQWEPLWNDLVRVTERLLAQPHGKHYPHFLGAVVFCREILFEMERRSWANRAEPLNIDGYTAEQLHYHVKILAEAGLIDAADASHMQGIQWLPLSLTWHGHEFLDASRDKERWMKAKFIIERVRGMTFEVLTTVLSKLATEAAASAMR